VRGDATHRLAVEHRSTLAVRRTTLRRNAKRRTRDDATMRETTNARRCDAARNDERTTLRRNAKRRTRGDDAARNDERGAMPRR